MDYEIGIESDNDYGTSDALFIHITMLGTTNLPGNAYFEEPTRVKSSSAQINWRNTPRATYYILTRNDQVIYQGPNNYFPDTGLDRDTMYHYTVQAFNSYGHTDMFYQNVTTNEDITEDEEDSATACLATTKEQTLTMPTGIKGGDTGKFDVNIVNTQQAPIHGKITNVTTSGNLFNGAYPFSLQTDNSTVTVAAGSSGVRSITWSLPAAAGTSLQSSTGQLTVTVQMDCS
jgi:hypothetical protein